MESDRQPPRVRMDVRVDPDQARWITLRARELSTSKSAVIRQAIRAAMRAETDDDQDGDRAA